MNKLHIKQPKPKQTKSVTPIASMVSSEGKYASISSLQFTAIENTDTIQITEFTAAVSK